MATKKKPSRAKRASAPKRATNTLRFTDGTPWHGQIVVDEHECYEGFISKNLKMPGHYFVSRSLNGLPFVSVPEHDILQINYTTFSSHLASVSPLPDWKDPA